MNIKLRIKGLQDLVELRYITHHTKHTFTEHRRIKLDGKIYEFGIGDNKNYYDEVLKMFDSTKSLFNSK